MNEVNSLKRTFYGLGSDRLWKQIVDGKYHQHGPLVFDLGLHRCHVEPGYLDGVTKGCEYAVEALSANDLSLDIYKGIHRTACGHFSGTRESGTGKRESIGAFRKSDVRLTRRKISLHRRSVSETRMETCSARWNNPHGPDRVKCSAL